MKVRISEIKPGGYSAKFEVETDALNARVAAVRDVVDPESVPPPDYVFENSPQADLKLELRGTTVLCQGTCTARYSTSCSRCLIDTGKDITVPITMVLKPMDQDPLTEEDVEDVQYGFYYDDQVDCNFIAHEFLILALPFIVLCEDSCKGLCSKCGVNLNTEECQCVPKGIMDERFSVLSQLKIQ